ncbi:hypothetical protein EG68_11695 [Paragonimus skrjabini miyazakii]|uniref:Uncharacterized protein n=1 Tax=Paragonimus skrjabini miyazakii TaxID=59628 RepID=A0A8S9YHR5_9TREM|nr:hypothetical protein EG68_11695 [Paragonimus skrjabini miyazakii]
MTLSRDYFTQCWPTRGRSVHPWPEEGFVGGLFCGDNKPTSVIVYLESSTAELDSLLRDGLRALRYDFFMSVDLQAIIYGFPALA